MTSHVIFLTVVVDDGRFREVLPIAMLEGIVEVVGLLTELGYGGRKLGFNVGVFSVGPVVLIAHICPPYLLVKYEPPLLILLHFLYLLWFLALFLLLCLCLFLLRV